MLPAVMIYTPRAYNEHRRICLKNDFSRTHNNAIHTIHTTYFIPLATREHLQAAFMVLFLIPHDIV